MKRRDTSVAILGASGAGFQASGLSASDFRPGRRKAGLGFPKPASVPPQPRSPEPGARSPQKSSDALMRKIRGTSTAVGAGHVALNSVP